MANSKQCSFYQLLVFETGTCLYSTNCFEICEPPPLPLQKRWEYRCVPPHLAGFLIMKKLENSNGQYKKNDSGCLSKAGMLGICYLTETFSSSTPHCLIKFVSEQNQAVSFPNAQFIVTLLLLTILFHSSHRSLTQDKTTSRAPAKGRMLKTDT